MVDEDYGFDVMISFDSHIDDGLAGFREEVVTAIEDNLPMRYTTGRAATHVAFRTTFGDSLDEIYVISPQSCIETSAGHIFQKMQETMDKVEKPLFERQLAKSKEEFIKQKLEFLRLAWGIQVIPCPPKDPVSVVKEIMARATMPLLDIDVDYFADMQNECYTPMKGAEPYQLGHLERVLRLIRSVKPPIITVSEATVKALNNPESKTNHLLQKLENMGYERENFFIFESDEKANGLMKLWEDFEKYWNEKRSDIHWISGKKEDEKIDSDELRNIAKEYFSANQHLMI